MANEEQLAILKQGVEAWNKWRDKNPEIEIDLSEADLSEGRLDEANFSNVDLRRANLSSAVLREANLYGADFIEANLSGANLSEADLEGADLYIANLNGAAFRGARLTEADLSGADLRQTSFIGANLRGANLAESNFFGARVGSTVFGNSDLSEALELDHVFHSSPSSISTDTFALSRGKIPKDFLRGCGLSDWEIEGVKLYNPDLSNQAIDEILYKMHDLRATQAIQISPLFISYTHADGSFVDNLEVYLNGEGIRFWRDIHDMKAGRMEKQIGRAIRQNPTVLLVLSEYSLNSDWVQHEVRAARELEKEMGRDVLCPVALDASWKSSPWPKRIMEQVMEYNILDFAEWRDDSKFDGMFRKLIDGLELFYKG